MNAPRSAGGIVMVDFDGTLYPWGQLTERPKPLPGAVKAMRELKKEGYTIGIFTSRLSPSWHRAEGWDTTIAEAEQRTIITEMLLRDGIPFSFITAEKMPAVLYLDDKSMRVTAERTVLNAVDAFLALGDDAI